MAEKGRDEGSMRGGGGRNIHNFEVYLAVSSMNFFTVRTKTNLVRDLITFSLIVRTKTNLVRDLITFSLSYFISLPFSLFNSLFHTQRIIKPINFNTS